MTEIKNQNTISFFDASYKNRIKFIKNTEIEKIIKTILLNEKNDTIEIDNMFNNPNNIFSNKKDFLKMIESFCMFLTNKCMKINNFDEFITNIYACFNRNLFLVDNITIPKCVIFMVFNDNKKTWDYINEITFGREIYEDGIMIIEIIFDIIKNIIQEYFLYDDFEIRNEDFRNTLFKNIIDNHCKISKMEKTNELYYSIFDLIKGNFIPRNKTLEILIEILKEKDLFFSEISNLHKKIEIGLDLLKNNLVISRKKTNIFQNLVFNRKIMNFEPHIELLKNINRIYPNLIPLKNNKVFDLKNKLKRNRTFKDYFSYKIERDYIPNNEKKTEFEIMLEDYFKYEDGDGEIHLDKEKFNCFKQCIGYSLTSSIEHKKLFILLGDTNTGKSTLFNLIQKAFNDFHIISSVSQDIFIEGNKSHIKSCYEKLDEGVNLGYCSEFKNEQILNEINIKPLTGFDQITYRPFYKTNKDFYNITKLFIFSNEMPKFNVVDNAIIDRLLFIPFNYDFKKHSTNDDKEKLEDFMDNHHDEKFSVFIDWMHEYIKNNRKIEIPKSLEDFKNEIRKEKNPLIDFIEKLETTFTKEELLNMKKSKRDEEYKNLNIITGEQFYDLYLIYCDKYKFHDKSSKQTFFKNTEKELENYIAKNQFRLEKKRISKLYGIKYNELFIYSNNTGFINIEEDEEDNDDEDEYDGNQKGIYKYQDIEDIEDDEYIEEKKEEPEEKKDEKVEEKEKFIDVDIDDDEFLKPVISKEEIKSSCKNTGYNFIDVDMDDEEFFNI